MSAVSRSAIPVIMIFTSCYLCAHEQAVSRSMKFESGFILSWQPVSSDVTENQVDIFDDTGHPVTGVNVLKLVPEARRVGIWDVSANGGLIAIAAVYENKQGPRQVRSTGTLLLFNLNGQLLSAFALEPSYEIALLAVDDYSNIWTLTQHADAKDPATVPMVVEYTREGRILRKVLTRSAFPFHASHLREEDPDLGAATMGYGDGVVWFWLPGSTDLVTISTSNGQVTTTKTQLPKDRSGHNVVPLGIRRERSGNIVASVGENDDQGRREIRNYSWSATTSWVATKPGHCEGWGRLIGVGQTGRVYRSPQADSTAVCTSDNDD